MKVNDIREMINRLKIATNALEDVLDLLEQPVPQGQVAVPLDEQGLGKTVIAMSGTPLKRSNDEMLKVFSEGWNSEAIKRTKLHWTQKPENRKKLRRVIKIMQQARLKK